MCIPRDLENKNGVGTNNLIKRGAKLVTNEQDVINEFIEFKNRKKINYINNQNVNSKYKDIYEHIKNEPITINDLSKLTKKSVIEIEIALTILELDGVIETIPNKGVVRK